MYVIQTFWFRESHAHSTHCDTALSGQNFHSTLSRHLILNMYLGPLLSRDVYFFYYTSIVRRSSISFLVVEIYEANGAYSDIGFIPYAKPQIAPALKRNPVICCPSRPNILKFLFPLHSAPLPPTNSGEADISNYQ